MKLKKIFLILLLLVTFTGLKPESVLAATLTSGDLQVTADEPVFSSATVWYPGLSIRREIVVKNLGGSARTLSVQAVNTSQTGSMAENLYVRFLRGGSTIYGDLPSKTMKKFWDDGQIDLFGLDGGQTANFDLEVQMPSSLGNEFQGKQAKFDMIIGFAGTGSQVGLSASGGGFEPEVLGTADNIASGGATSTSTGEILMPEILGLNTDTPKANWWWILLLPLLLLLAILFFLRLRRSLKRPYNDK